jgi:predicted kinase
MDSNLGSVPSSGKATSQALAHHLRTEIEAGRLAHRAPLPTSKQLAAEWDTSPATVSRAMDILAAEGLIIGKPRAGRIVNYPPPAERSAPSRPKVLLIGGYAGSGKTELGRILARMTHWPMLDKDTTTRPVVEQALELLGESPHDRESTLYRDSIRPAEYEALIAGMIENVECGTSAIVTAPFSLELADRTWCDRTAANLARLGADLHVIWVRCDAESMRRYIRHRGAARDAAKLANWEEYVSGLDLAFEPAFDHHTIISNSADARPLQEQAEQLLATVTT